MPKKLQIKLLSESGELLNVVNCVAGNISVLRAHSPTDLRPYQRALVGVPTKERFVLQVDGKEYQPSEHNVIGFGEAAMSAPASMRTVLVERGCSEESVDALLMSFGLERSADTPCCDLAADQERRLRILLATLEPEKALIVNEPFEPISSQWRERAADVLLSFARSQNGLVVVPSLSYRPEGWIDNQAIARIQVGQTLQKTIGFGAAGSQANAMMEELRNRVRAEHSEDVEKRPPSHTPTSAAAAAAAAPLTVDTTSTSAPALERDLVHNTWFSSVVSSASQKALLVATSLAVVGGIAFFAVSERSQDASSTEAIKVASELPPPPPPQPPVSAQTAPIEAPAAPDEALQRAAAKNDPDVQANDKPAHAMLLVLDHYPAAIREALLETARGVASDVSQETASREPQRPATGRAEGNLFKLLEQAGGPERPGQPGSPEEIQPPAAANWEEAEPMQQQEPEDAEERREAIRQKFLEAIRAAAERRESEMAVN